MQSNKVDHAYFMHSQLYIFWDSQVHRISDSEFTVAFPSRETWRMCTVSGKLYLPMSKSETSIREAFLSPKPSLVLPSTWVKMMGVPEDLMTKERLRAAFVMVGRVIDVDELFPSSSGTESRFGCASSVISWSVSRARFRCL
jgi:hypothetical protein